MCGTIHDILCCCKQTLIKIYFAEVYMLGLQAIQGQHRKQPKIPSKLLHDFAPRGPIFIAAAACHQFKARNPTVKRIDFLSPARRSEVRHVYAQTHYAFSIHWKCSHTLCGLLPTMCGGWMALHQPALSCRMCTSGPQSEVLCTVKASSNLPRSTYIQAVAAKQSSCSVL